MSNEFNKKELARWYSHEYRCRLTGKNTGNAFHHCIPRSNPLSNALVNATLVDNDEHLARHGEICLRPQQEKFIADNVQFLASQGYKFTDLDKEFLLHYDFLDVIKNI